MFGILLQIYLSLGTISVLRTIVQPLHSYGTTFVLRARSPSLKSYWRISLFFQLTVTYLFTRGPSRLVSLVHINLFTRSIHPAPHTYIVPIVLYRLFTSACLQGLSTLCCTHLALTTMFSLQSWGR